MSEEPGISRKWLAALGELVLIVAGVLLALWVEDWRQARTERAMESEYLGRFIADLDQDVTALEYSIRHTETRSEHARLALAFLDADALEGDGEVLESLNYAGFISFFRHTRGTFDDLLSTGNLKLLQNKNLVSQISAYYRSTDFLDEFDDNKKQAVWFGYRLQLDRHVPSLLFVDLAERAAPADPSGIDWRGLRANPEIRSALGRVLAIAAVERIRLERVLDLATELRVAILEEEGE